MKAKQVHDRHVVLSEIDDAAVVADLVLVNYLMLHPMILGQSMSGWSRASPYISFFIFPLIYSGENYRNFLLSFFTLRIVIPEYKELTSVYNMYSSAA